MAAPAAVRLSQQDRQGLGAETLDPYNDPKQVEKSNWVSCTPDSFLKIGGGPWLLRLASG